MNPHEELFVSSFIISAKRDRYLSFLGDPKRRQKILDGLYHMRDLDEESATTVAPNEQRHENIYQILRSKGSPEICYVISTNRDLDGKELRLAEVLEEIVGTGDDGTIVSCIPGKLVYYEGEDPGTRYVLEKKC
jgi:hypothetical protein